MIYDVFISVVCFERSNNLHSSYCRTVYSEKYTRNISLNVLLTTYFLYQLCVFMPLKEWNE